MTQSVETEYTSAKYCICDEESLENTIMICCDKCEKWFHYSCLQQEFGEEHDWDELVNIPLWHCPLCCKRRKSSKRNEDKMMSVSELRNAKTDHAAPMSKRTLSDMLPRVYRMQREKMVDMNIQFLDTELDTDFTGCNSQWEQYHRGLMYLNSLAMGEIAEFKSFAEMRGSNNDRVHVLIDREREKVVGYFTYTRNSETMTACLGQIYVLPSYRKKGMATLMVRYFLHQMFKGWSLLQIEEPNECICRLLCRMKCAHMIQTEMQFSGAQSKSIRKKRKLAMDSLRSTSPDLSKKRLASSVLIFQPLKKCKYASQCKRSNSPSRNTATISQIVRAYIPRGNIAFLTNNKI